MAGATVGDGRLSFGTPTFSIYAAAENDPGVTPARGLVRPPEVVPGGQIRGLYDIDRSTGLVYFVPGGDGGKLQRARLEETIVVETVYEAPAIKVVAVDASAVYFHLPGQGAIARLSHDLSDLNPTWSVGSYKLGGFNDGVGRATTKHVYLEENDREFQRRIPLAGGPPTASPFKVSVSKRCGFSPDGLRAACTTNHLDFATDTATSLDPISNGWIVGDGEFAIHTTRNDSGDGSPVVRVGFGGTPARVTIANVKTDAAAAHAGVLYLSIPNGIVALDATTGAERGRLTSLSIAPSVLEVWPPYLYYRGTGNGGMALERVRLDALAPR